MCLLLVTEPSGTLPGGSPGLAGEQVSGRHSVCVCVGKGGGGGVISFLPVKDGGKGSETRRWVDGRPFY